MNDTYGIQMHHLLVQSDTTYLHDTLRQHDSSEFFYSTSFLYHIILRRRRFILPPPNPLRKILSLPSNIQKPRPLLQTRIRVSTTQSYRFDLSRLLTPL